MGTLASFAAFTAGPVGLDWFLQSETEVAENAVISVTWEFAEWKRLLEVLRRMQWRDARHSDAASLRLEFEIELAGLMTASSM